MLRVVVSDLGVVHLLADAKHHAELAPPGLGVGVRAGLALGASALCGQALARATRAARGGGGRGRAELGPELRKAQAAHHLVVRGDARGAQALVRRQPLRARAREEQASRRGGERVSRAHASRRARVERERKRRVARGTGKKEDVGRPARGGGARTHVVGLACVRHRGARAGARRLRAGSTCACELGCGAGEQPEEYLLSTYENKALSRPLSLSRLARGAVLSTRRTPPGLPWCPSTRTWSFESGRA